MQNTLAHITDQIRDCSDTPALDAQNLLAHILKKESAWVLAHPETKLSSTETQALQNALHALQNGAPLPYVLGRWEFFGLDFIVTPETLIPRPETEELVETALEWLRDKKGTPLSAVDVGTGSGCIAIALTKHIRDLNLLAVDLSSAALQIARQNANKHDLGARIQFLQSNLFRDIPADIFLPFDLIVANLPYIPSATLRDLDVYQREPTLALDGGADGLDIIRRLLADAPRWLAAQGLILLEIDSSHGQTAVQLAQDVFPQAKTQLLQDLSGRDRFIRIQT